MANDIRKIVATASALALIFSGGMATAQTSASARAQQLIRVEEGLASPDPNIRLATFEEAIESQSLALRSRAVAIALASGDETLRALGLRSKICSMGLITMQHDLPSDERVQRSFRFLTSQIQQIRLVNCQISSGLFTIPPIGPEAGRSTNTGQGSISGLNTSLSWNYYINVNYSYNCIGHFRMNNINIMIGYISCSRGSINSGQINSSFSL